MPLAADVSIFHNTLRPRDVNADGVVTPQDALIVIIALNQDVTLEGLLASRGGKGMEGEGQDLFKFDTNSDGFLSPMDAVGVINHLNSHGEGGTPAMEYIVRTFSADGSTPVSNVSVGQQFQLRVYVRDVRNDVPQGEGGVFSGYTDVNFDPNLVSSAGPIQHNQTAYGQSPNGTISNGVINAAGSFSGSLSPLGKGELLLWSLTMTADRAGVVTFDGNPATDAADPGDAGHSPAFDTGVYGQDRPVCPSAAQTGCDGDVVHMDATLTIGEGSNPGDDVFSAPEDTSGIRLNVLDNKVPIPPNATLTITGISQTSHGGQAVNNGTFITYTPAANFVGQEIFTYTVSNGQGGTATYRAIVNVLETNDAPVFDGIPSISGVRPDTDVLIRDISVADVDGTATVFELELSVADGRLTVVPNGVSVVGNSTANVTIAGSLAAIEAVLGAGVTYRSNAGFNGQEILRGKISDQAASSGFERRFTVGDIIGSQIGGAVFVDVDGDGVRDPHELGVEGVRIHLTGTDMLNQLVQQSVLTSANGDYSFANVLPGLYMLNEEQPPGMLDGHDSFDSLFVRAGNDRATIHLEVDGLASLDNLFAEIGMQAHHTRAAFDLLASSAGANNSVGLIVGMNGQSAWHVVGGDEWSGYHDARVTVNNVITANGRQHANVTLRVRNAAGVEKSVTLDSSTNPRLIFTEHNGTRVFGFRGGPMALFGS